jgi:uncharacterized protein YeaO (DUF488 family)
MSKPLKLRTFRIGEPARRGEGLRIGTTRRPPRGVAKSRWQADGYFDVWLPSVAPSPALLRRFRKLSSDPDGSLEPFFEAYEREMSRSEARQTIALLAALAQRTPIAIGCYCADETRCHRSRLKRLIEDSARAG